MQTNNTKTKNVLYSHFRKHWRTLMEDTGYAH